MQRDDELRLACFLALDALRAELGEDLPYHGGLARRFAFEGRGVPFLTYQKGIYRAAAQRGPAALSINTSYRSPYRDEETPDGFLYDYRAGSLEQPDNRALRAAYDLQVPIVYFVPVAPGWYRPLYPAWIAEDRRSERQVLVSVGVLDAFGPTPVPVPLEDALERRYATRETRVRLHQARFRRLVVPAYRDRCAICSLKEIRLLDAAHILPDAHSSGVASVSNGLSLCSIHHRAFDQDLVGVSPDYRVHVSRRLRDEEDGPMLELLKGFHGAPIVVPRARARRPDPVRLAERFDRFRGRA